MIPLFDPRVGALEKDFVNIAMDSNWLSEGSLTQKFEKKLAEHLGVKYVVTVSSGGVALYLALKAVGVGSGDRVAMPVYQHISLANAVSMLGAKPYFHDVSPDNGLCEDIPEPCYTAVVNMNGRYTERALNVSFPCIEDSCQALASSYYGRHLMFGVAGCLSFHPTKIVQTGNGGAVFTNEESIYAEVKAMKDYGRMDKSQEYFDCWGMNFRLTDLQAAIGIAQMETLPVRSKRMRWIYDRYQKEVHDIVQFKDHEGFVPWICDVKLRKRGMNKLLQERLLEKGIQTGIPFSPLNLQPLYSSHHYYLGAFGWYMSCLWLPSSPYHSDEMVTTVIDTLNKEIDKN